MRSTNVVAISCAALAAIFLSFLPDISAQLIRPQTGGGSGITNGQLSLSGDAPYLRVIDTEAAADEGCWEIQLDFDFVSCADNGDEGSILLDWARGTGTDVDSVTVLDIPLVTFSQDVAVTGDLSVGSCSGCGGGFASGTFSITWDDACSTSPTSAVAWRQSGDVVMWRISAMSGTNCTSDSTAFQTTATIVPSGIRPTIETTIPLPHVKNNGNVIPGCIVIRTNGTVAIDWMSSSTVMCQGGSWTNSGQKSVGTWSATSISYVQ